MEKPKLEDSKIIPVIVVVGVSCGIACGLAWLNIDPHILHLIEFVIESFK